MLDLTQLEQLITFYKEGTITKAAEKLLISQPALTRSLQRLEEDLQVTLFVRQKNKTTFTPTGEFVVNEAKKLLDSAESFLESVRHENLKNTTLFIGVCAPGPIIELEHQFKDKKYAFNIKYELKTGEALLNSLIEEKYQVIITDKVLNDPRFISKPIFKEQLNLAVLPTHPLANKKQIELNDLTNSSMLVLTDLGVWNELVDSLNNIHFIRQQDNNAFNDLINVSNLPYFTTNITQLYYPESNKIEIPISDEIATKTYYVNVLKKNRGLLKLF